MLSRKLYAAFITSVIGFFIAPLLFEFGTGYNLFIGLAVSLVAVPTLFVGGVLSSLAIEHYSKSDALLLSYFKHLVCALICVLLFTIVSGSLLLSALVIGIVYVTIFFIVDVLTKYVEARSTLFN
ncbi:hypothetical protein [Ureibacillus manganicus]|uniref:Uncharacterized protein n=1 Tax=Ureibacillus manganicus DSM 26584 TaxID=1384049 RepID=A0A0A3I3J7_9BACL|nr:hypothetical protein [Ureibacillus manganicus]KGR77253.1 hypothetical protein CD29_15425 [Ureibacillus manganicus DSM 26584]